MKKAAKLKRDPPCEDVFDSEMEDSLVFCCCCFQAGREAVVEVVVVVVAAAAVVTTAAGFFHDGVDLGFSSIVGGGFWKIKMIRTKLYGILSNKSIVKKQAFCSCAKNNLKFPLFVNQ